MVNTSSNMLAARECYFAYTPARTCVTVYKAMQTEILEFFI